MWQSQLQQSMHFNIVDVKCKLVVCKYCIASYFCPTGQYFQSSQSQIPAPVCLLTLCVLTACHCAIPATRPAPSETAATATLLLLQISGPRIYFGWRYGQVNQHEQWWVSAASRQLMIELQPAWAEQGCHLAAHCTAGRKTGFKVWTYNWDNSTSIKLGLAFYAHWL